MKRAIGILEKEISSCKHVIKRERESPTYSESYSKKYISAMNETVLHCKKALKILNEDGKSEGGTTEE